MSRIQLALRVGDLEQSIAFYTALFGTEPAKRRPGYANFAITEPPLKLVLLEGENDQQTVMDHLGVEVASTEAVDDATERFKNSGLATFEEADSDCCYAVQDKVWVHGPGKEPWEVYVVKADGTQLDKTAPPAVPGAADTSEDASTSKATSKTTAGQRDACCDCCASA
ncbi:hypothetical protein BH23ACT6_BH23ACT6_09680 [soil metagenome]